MTGAIRPNRRNTTAKEAAARLGKSERTIRRYMAEPREDFLQRAKDRRERVAELRAAGMKYVDIADTLGLPIGTVRRLIYEARKAGLLPAD